MLVDKVSSLENKVVAIKLISGEEIVAKCLEFDPDKKIKVVKIKQPVVLFVDSPRQTTNGSTKVHLEPWMLSIPPSTVISLRYDHIVYIAEAAENAGREYARLLDQATANVN